MQILIADDDAVSRRVLQATLSSAGYDVLSAEDGRQAWDILQGPRAPQLAILDWIMPEIDGVQICQRLRQPETTRYTYVILLTAKEQKHDMTAGLEAGADDYVTKPYDREEILSRLRAGERILRLHWLLEGHVEELQNALAHVKKLQGLLPICMHCKSVRDDENAWHRIETYIEHHSEAMFTHSLCQGCLNEHYPDYAEDDEREREGSSILATGPARVGTTKGGPT